MTTKQALLLSASLLILGFYHQNNAQSDKPRYQNIPGVEYADTPKVKYQYVFKMIVDINVWDKAIDTIDMIFDEFGKSMSVDQAQLYKNLYNKQMNKVKVFLDSIKLPEPQKPKK